MPDTCIFNLSQFLGGGITAAMGGIIGYCSAMRVARFNAKLQAAIVYRNALDGDFIQDSTTGYILVNALTGVTTGGLAGSQKIAGAYAKHKRAVREFRFHLSKKERRRLDEAWNEYTGGNEDYPDFFVMYGMPGDGCPDKGQQLLRQRLEKLRSIGS